MDPTRPLVLAILALFLTATLPAAGSTAGALAHDHGSGSILPDGAVAIPLKGEPPAWLTPEVRAEASKAAGLGMGYDVEEGVYVPAATQYTFIRPGAWMLFPALCTVAFAHGGPGSWSMSTAGHCLEGGSEVIIAAAPSLIFAIGKGRGHAGDVGNDYGFINIYDQFQAYVDPDVAVIQGPGPSSGCGSYDAPITLTDPMPVKHFGHGVVVGAGGTPRAGVSFFANQRDPTLEGGFSDSAVYWDSPSAPGDSGSPVLAAATADCPLGSALAILTHLVVVGHEAQLVAGTNMNRVGDAAPGNGLPV